jgi:acylphosphatase
MKAVNIILKGEPHKSGLRHFFIAKAKESGINGYINYRQQGEELFIHAEGSTEALNQYLFWLHNRIAELQVIMEYIPASIFECQNFQIVCDSSLLEEVSPEEYSKATFIESVNPDEIEIESKTPFSEWIRTPIRAGVSRMLVRLKLAGLF